MRTLAKLFQIATLMVLGSAGAVASPPVLEAVGPVRAIDTSGLPAGTGMLQVHSDTYKVAAGRDGSAATHPHSGFLVLDANGDVRLHADNHGDDRHESPVGVALPAGRYLVKARSSDFGSVTVPVQIAAGQLTAVYLEAGGMPPGLQPAGRPLVKWPNGRVVGVRAGGRVSDSQSPGKTR